MNNEMDLMQRLAVSKKIMEKHSEIKRGDARQITPMVEEYSPVNANYNLPSELLTESEETTQRHDPSVPLDQNRILNSKLPDEIKRLMIEQPIVQPSSMGGGAVLSNDIIEGAARLMKKEKISEIPQTQTPKQKINETYTTSNINVNEIKNMIRDVVRDTVRDVVREELKQAGMIVESTTKTNETLQFKVGNTLFVGNVTKVKKLEK
jgi:hypothetical protein